MRPIPESPMRDQDTFRLPRWATSEPPGCICIGMLVQMVYGSLWQPMAMGLSWSHIVSTSGDSSKNPRIQTNLWISLNLNSSGALLIANLFAIFEKLQQIHQDTCMPRSLVVVAVLAVLAAGSVPLPPSDLSDLSEERPDSDRWPQWHWMHRRHRHSQRPELPRLPTASSSAGKLCGVVGEKFLGTIHVEKKPLWIFQWLGFKINDSMAQIFPRSKPA